MHIVTFSFCVSQDLSAVSNQAGSASSDFPSALHCVVCDNEFDNEDHTPLLPPGWHHAACTTCGLTPLKDLGPAGATGVVAPSQPSGAPPTDQVRVNELVRTGRTGPALSRAECEDADAILICNVCEGAKFCQDCCKQRHAIKILIVRNTKGYTFGGYVHDTFTPMQGKPWRECYIPGHQSNFIFTLGSSTMPAVKLLKTAHSDGCGLVMHSRCALVLGESFG